MTVNYEVEQKHRVDDTAALAAQLERRGAKFGQRVVQSDQYFAHPVRDFAATDEALRIRTVGEASFVTYKGPKLAGLTKTRCELELPLDASDASGGQFAELLAALGFSPVATVRKQRREFQLAWGDWVIDGALDEVDDLGSFVELELVADDDHLPAAQRAVATLADDLQLGPSERLSYLELLLGRS